MVLGCRGQTTAGSSLSTSGHLLAGRAESLGGPFLTPTEQARGWVGLTDAYLLPLESGLRSRFDLSVRLELDVQEDGAQVLPGAVNVFATDMVLGQPTPLDGVPVWLATTLASPFDTLDTRSLVSEYARACDNPMLANSIPGCGAIGFNLGLPSPNPIDAIEASPDTRSIRVGWHPPLDAFNVYSTTRSAGDPPRRQGEECDGDRPCEDGLACLQTAPLPEPRRCGCASDRNCPDGFTCAIETGRCEWTPPTCTTDAECVLGRDFGDSRARCGGDGLCERLARYRWSADPSLDHPVLGVDVRWEVDTDPDDAVEFAFLQISLQNFSTRLRFQARPCTGVGCTNVRRIYAGYYPAPVADLLDSGVGLEGRVGGEILDYNVEIRQVGILCHLTGWGLCAILEHKARENLSAAFSRLGNRIGSITSALVSAPEFAPTQNSNTAESLAISLSGIAPASAPGATPWAEAVAAFPGVALDLRQTAVQFNRTGGGTPSAPAPLLAPDGAASGTLYRFLSETRAGLSQVALTTGGLANLCGPQPQQALGGLCAGTAPPPQCRTICQPCVAAGPTPLCNFSGNVILVPIPLPVTLNPLPRVPGLAIVADASYGIEAELRSVFSNVLAPLRPSFRRPTDIAYCAAGETSFRCPSDGTIAGDRVVMHFSEDGDLDAVPDAFDSCPDDFNLELPGGLDDWDSDGHGNVCDLCPLNAGPNREASGMPGVGESCSCDIDGDGCANPLEGEPVDPPHAVDREPVRECAPTGPIWDEEPRNSDNGYDLDGDGLGAHCDRDDDGDGVREDGAGDGHHVYTPCAPGASASCDDNCAGVTNPDQEDSNGDGIGDACDPVCGAGETPWFCDVAGGEHFRPDFGPGMPWDWDAGCPECVLGVMCAEPAPSSAPFGWPGIGGCGPGDAALTAFGDLLARLSDFVQPEFLRELRLSAAILVGDQDGDGLRELVLGLAGLSPQVPGRVLLIRSASRAVAWESRGDLVGAWAFGTALAEVPGHLAVGAPDFLGYGAVVLLDLQSGTPVADLSLPANEHHGLGVSLSYEGGSLYAGAPFALGSYGAIYRFSLDDAGRPLGDLPLEPAFRGDTPGGFLGSGPIVAFERLGERFVFAGSPMASSGAGALWLFGPSEAEAVHRFVGEPGDLFGAAVAVVDPLSRDGDLQALVGAPGAFGGAGMLVAITGSWEAAETGIRGRDREGPAGFPPPAHARARLRRVRARLEAILPDRARALGAPPFRRGPPSELPQQLGSHLIWRSGTEFFVGASGQWEPEASWPGAWAIVDYASR